MEYKIKRSYRRSVSIKIKENGEVVVNAPYKFSIKNIEQILASKQDWINKGIEKVKTKFQEKALFYEYKKVMFLGNEYEVKQDKNLITIGDNTIKIRKGTQVKVALKKWLNEMANCLILKRIDEICDAYNFSYKTSKIISARKKWGSCDNLKNISINFRLVMLPIECIDYVCIHELCHTKYMNHSKEFYKEIEKVMPNYKVVNKNVSKFNFVLELF